MIGTSEYFANAFKIGSVRSSSQSFKAANVLTPMPTQYLPSTRTTSATCSVLSPSIPAPSACSSVQLVPPGSSTTTFPPSSKTPTCIEARVRKLGLKKTSATERPSRGFVRSSPRLNLRADSINSSSSSRVQSAVVRKSLGINTLPNYQLRLNERHLEQYEVSWSGNAVLQRWHLLSLPTM